jgi:purine nucleoside permease
MTARTQILLALFLPFALTVAVQAKPRPIQVKVVVVAMFEVGADTGDQPGELQYWVERDHLDRIYPLPAGYHAVRMNGDGEMAVLTGQGTAHAAATIMALGLDPRFDLSACVLDRCRHRRRYPDKVSLGSAAWARWVVDGDLGYEIDARETPPDWTTGYVPLRKSKPFEDPAAPLPGQVYALNKGLAEWAYNLTRATPLADSDHLKEIRSNFDGVAANKPPFVIMGDEVSSSRYWHGKLFDAWAAEWMRYFTNGQGEFATTAMEDTGTLQSLEFLADAHRVDGQRIMVLRTVSNYDRQPRGMTAAESLATQRIGKYSGYLPSLEAAYTVGHVVVHELLTHWTQYEQATPGADKAAPVGR